MPPGKADAERTPDANDNFLHGLGVMWRELAK